VKFTSPSDIKGTAFLQIEHIEADDDEWIYSGAGEESASRGQQQEGQLCRLGFLLWRHFSGRMSNSMSTASWLSGDRQPRLLRSRIPFQERHDKNRYRLRRAHLAEEGQLPRNKGGDYDVGNRLQIQTVTNINCWNLIPSADCAASRDGEFADRPQDGLDVRGGADAARSETVRLSFTSNRGHEQICSEAASAPPRTSRPSCGGLRIHHLSTQRNPALGIRFQQFMLGDGLDLSNRVTDVVVLHLCFEEVVLPQPGELPAVADIGFCRVALGKDSTS